MSENLVLKMSENYGKPTISSGQVVGELLRIGLSSDEEAR